MTNLSTLSDDELRTLYSAPQKSPMASMSDEQLKQAYASASPKQETGIGDTILRKLGIGTRAVAEGLGEVPGMVYDAAAVPVNAGIAGYNALTGGNRAPIAPAREQIQQGLSAAGLPEPETRGERMVSAVNRGAASMIPAMGAGVGMSNAASPLTRGIGEILASQPASQVAAGAGGATGSQSAKEMGFGPFGQAVGGFAGALAAPAALSGAGRLIGPQVRPQVQELMDKGVTPTYGQIQGRGAGALEDIAARLPGIGPRIQEAQERATQQFSTAAINDALAPVGQRVQVGQSGNKAIAEAHAILSDEYKNVLGPIKAMPDDKFLAGVRAAASKAPAEELSAVKDAITEQFGNVTGQLSGDKLQQARRYFERLSYDTENPAAGKAYQGIADSITDLMTRSAPGSAAALGAVDKAWSMFKRVQDAATREATSGTFTPSNLAASSKKLDRFNDYVPYSEGRAVMQPMAQSGLNVLGTSPIARGEPPLSLPQALAHPLALMGGWARYPIYTPTGQRLTAQALTQRPDYAKALAEALRMNAPMAGMAGAVSR